MRICLIGPTYPFRGGIAHYTTLLGRYILESSPHEGKIVSFSRQYPSFLYRGESDQDPSATPLTVPATYPLDSMNPLSWRQTIQEIVAWSPDIVVMQWWTPFWALCWRYLIRQLKRNLPGLAVITICHNVLTHEESWYDAHALSLAVGQSDGFVVHSQTDGAHLAEILPTPYRQTPLPTYAAIGGESVNRGRTAGTPSLLFCGLVRHYKGLDVLIEALPIVLKKKDLHLTIVGEFWDVDVQALQARIHALGIAEAVTIVPEYVPDETLIEYVRTADALVLPYRSATQSAVIQLAFGQYRPVITTDVGGLPEAVAHEETGLIVPSEDPRALAQAILHLYEGNRWEQFTAEIKERQENFSWSHLLDSVIELATREAKVA